MAFPPARNPRSGKQYKHRTRKKEKIKIISLILYPFILKSKVFHCYENGSTKNLIHHSGCTRCIFVQKVKWNVMAVSFYVTLDPTRSPSWSAPSPPRWSRRQGWALPLSAPSSFQWSGWLPPALWVPSQCNVDWRLRKIRDIFSTPRIMAKVREAPFWNVLFPLTLSHLGEGGGQIHPPSPR